MTVIGVIPARYGSTRLPAKVLADLKGKPMVQRVYERAKRAQRLDRVIVATDDERIVTVVRSFGGEAVMTSPDISSGTDRVAAVAESVEGDIFVNIQGDEPLMAPEMIDEGVAVVANNPGVVVGTLIRMLDRSEDLTNPAVVKVVVDANGEALYFSRSPIPHLRDEPNIAAWPGHAPYFKHIGLYVFRKDFLKIFTKLPASPLERTEKLEQLRILESGYRIRTAVTSYDSIPVDTAEDLKRVAALIGKD